LGHAEGNILWRIKPWKISQQRLEQQRLAGEAYKKLVDERKEALEQLTTALIRTLLVDRDVAHSIALKMLANKSVQAATIFGIDIQNVPELPVKHMIFDEKGNYYEL
jgi:hypothetical protein